MDGDTVGGVSSSNLFWFLLTVKGADLPDRTVDELDRPYNYQPAEDEDEDPVMRLRKHSSIQDDGEIGFTQKGQKVVFTYFKSFYINRIQFEGLDVRRKRPPPVIEMDLFKKGPEISETSSLLA